jgi:hypothetical protein
MEVQDVPPELQEQLGPEATEALVELLDRAREESTVEITAALAERFDRRLSDEAAGIRRDLGAQIGKLREDTQLGHARLREDMANLKFDVLKWSFAFSMTHTVIVVTFVGLMLQAMQR